MEQIFCNGIVLEDFHDPGSVEMAGHGGEVEDSQCGSLKGRRNDLESTNDHPWGFGSINDDL